MGTISASKFIFFGHLSALMTTAQVVAKRVLPSPVRQWLWRLGHNLSFWPPIGWVCFVSLRRVNPISQIFGLERGQGIDRYYIEKFLAQYAADICGCVLEVADNRYTSRFGGERVTKSDVLHVQSGNPRATIVADLASYNDIASDSFDCIIVTQTLQFIYDVRAAILTLHRILKPDGVLLATFPGISQISRYDMERWGEYWRFTTRSARKLFEEAFPAAKVTVEAHGNVLAASAFLQGLALEDVRPEELNCRDPNYEVLITVRAVKSGENL
jgi:SAM-dependent methyltransferase